MPNLNDKQKTEYWTQRAEQRLINAENLTEDMLKNLKITYEQAIKSIEKEINAFYGKYATETGLDLTEVRKRLNPEELKDFKKQLTLYYDEVKRLGGYSPDTKEYLRELSAKAYISRLEELQANIRWEVESLYRQQQLRIFEVLSKGYEETYYRTNFDMQQGIGFAYSFTALNTKAVEKAVTQKWQGSNFSDRIWTDKAKLIDTLNQTIPQSIALGQNPRKVARNIAKTMETKFSNAERLARTEINHIDNQASLDAAKEVPEVLNKYQYNATLDSRTSEICGDLDGKVFLMKDAQEGVNFPPMHPNCRSGWIPYFDDMPIDELGRIAIDYTADITYGRRYYVPSNMTYKEWKDSLNEKQQKCFIKSQKAAKQYSQDVEQLKKYKELKVKGLPNNIKDFQQMKYFEPEKYEILKENARIVRSEKR